MRPQIPAGVAAAALLFVTGVAAQDDPCTETDPCLWYFDVDTAGIESLEPAFNFTEGDWVAIDVFNFDEADHALQFAGQTWTASAFDGFRSAAFQVPGPGAYELADLTAGHAVPVTVYAAEADPFNPAQTENTPADASEPPSAAQDGPAAEAERAPGLLGLGAVTLAAALARKR